MVKVESDGTRIITLSKDYLASLETWEEIDDFCDGDRRVLVEKYLIPHESERVPNKKAQNLWADRKKRTGYENDTQPFLDIHSGHLARNVNFGKLNDNEQFKLIIEDATGYGEGAQEMYEQMVELRLKHGLLAVLVDGPATIAENKADAVAAKERSYQVIFNARQILNYEWFNDGPRKGQLKQIVLQADQIEKDGQMMDAVHRFYLPEGADRNPSAGFIKELLYTDDEDKKGSTSDKKRFKLFSAPVLGSIPQIPIEVIGRGLKDSKMRSVTQQAWKLFNSRSVRDSINYNQGFLWVILVGTKETEITSRAEFQITLISNPEAKVMSVPAGEPTGYETQIKGEENKLKRIGLWEYNQLTSEDTAQVSSADSKAQDAKARLKIYEDITKELERAGTRIFKLHALYEGVNEKEVSISVERDFGLDDETATQATRGIQFSRAGTLGARDIQKNILMLDVAEMDVIPKDGEDKDEARQRLMDSIENAEPPAPVIPGGSFFNKKPVENKPNDDAQNP
jgi:hypothetical protein